MSAETISCLNFIVHSLVIGAVAWLLVRFVIRDALRRCILANLAVLMCLYSPFNISREDLFPQKKKVPVWTPIRETFKADWRISVTPASAPKVNVAAETRAWDVDEVVKVLRWLSWSVTAALLLRLLYQCVRVQLWAWRLRQPTSIEYDKLPEDLSAERVCVFEQEGTPCVAGWFFPVIAVPAAAFRKLTPRQWGWLLRHEAEHLRLHDTVAALLQNIVRAFLWWNPFAHALIEEYGRAREEACDAAAVGEEREHTAYADFLLGWAGQAVPQHGCVMPIAHSRPAKRLKVRLVALMEARGVRKKLGALFVLALLAFMIIAPLIAASFGIASASAQAVVDAKADDGTLWKRGTLWTREYKVAPDFLSAGTTLSDPFAPRKATAGAVRGKTARELLREKGASFPPGASAIYNPKTSQLIVRNTKSNLEVMDGIIDALNQRPMMVQVTCKLIQADEFLGSHESILSSEDVQALIRMVSQKRGVELMSSPSVTMKFDQNAIVEVVQEVLPKPLPNGKLSGDLKFVGVRIELNAKTPVEGKSTVETKVNVGLDPDSDAGWLPQKEKAADWDKIRLFSLAAKAALASGETLVLHLPTSKRPVTVFITAEALNPNGGKADSFSATMRMAPSASQGRDVPEKKGTELVVREYRVPAGFWNGKPPLEYLQEKGVVFPPGASAQLADGRLTVQNTPGNLDLIDELVAAGLQKLRRIQLTVQVAEVSEEAGKSLGEWNLGNLTWKRDGASNEVPISQAPPEIRHLFAIYGTITEAQLQTLAAAIKQKQGAALVSLPKAMAQSGQNTVFDVPAQLGGKQIRIKPDIEPYAGTFSLSIQLPDLILIPAHKNQMVAEVMIGDGQTVIFSGNPADKTDIARIFFITATLIDPSGDPVKK